MSTELTVLVALGLLALLQQHLPSVNRLARPGGLGWGVGNRETTPELAPWAARADRAHRNLMENLPHWTMFTLAAVVAGRTDGVTATASLVFLGARVVHAAVYVAGIPYARTAAYATAVGAELVLVSRLF